ncbi:hypothetical protein AB1Y20_013418 [Prymnesium parvum]|uniref:Uncharacterized protein n=1 Tax=Prymnesium parvum TaxID=97485 RepID=A0AB34IJ06_PRYPA
MKHAFAELQLWLAGDAISFSAEHRGSWMSWHNFRLETSRGRPLFSKMRIVLIGILQRIVLLSGVAARLETNSGSKPSWRSLLILSSCTFFCMFQVIFYVFACFLSPITARGSSFLGFSRIALAFRLVLASLVIVLYVFLHHQLLSQYILLDFSWNGFLNVVLLIFSGGSVGSLLIQVFAVLESTKFVDPRLDGHASIRVKAALRRYSEFWYFGFDAAVSLTLSLVWILIAMMPILYLQSRLLFNRDFANVITLKIRRSEFLTKLLS